MTVLHRSAGIAAAVAVMAGLVWGSNVPMTAHGSANAVLRLAWSARPERTEDCRQRSEEELAKLPSHMRQPVACEGTTSQYRLRVLLDSTVVVDRIVHGGGLRRDRRLYVFEEIARPSGEATVDIRFDRVDVSQPGPAVDTTAPGTPDRKDVSPAQRGEYVPPHLSLERRLRFSSRKVILVTYSPERRALVVVQDPVRAPQ
jgi:hypothetical protein